MSPDPAGQNQPIKTALASAAEGEVLVLKPGIYRETLVIGKRVTLKGEPGAALDGTIPLPADWQPAGAELRECSRLPSPPSLPDCSWMAGSSPSCALTAPKSPGTGTGKCCCRKARH
ncbi:hypothetical protein [Verrucomicrobium spinosum]|uniref:hypothetical protein n=1 Tax=Verrucomicrobium spinosum TaxID=2736 RepID=UPI00155DCE0A|nr:hypothetical protein [Verrucomicrobium spinosum]